MEQTIVISDAEWEVMRVLWTLGPQKSQIVIKALTEKMGWKPATIKTLLGRLVKKGALTTQQADRSYIYKTAVDEVAMMNSASDSLFDHMCAMKVGEALYDTIDQLTLSQQDIEKLQGLLADKVKTAPVKVSCDCVPADLR